MNKSFNEIKVQEQRVLALCAERGRYCDNAKNRLDTQRVAQITRNALTQHGFPIFGIFDKEEKRAFIHREQPKPEPEPIKVEEPKPLKEVRPTPTEVAGQKVAFFDWMRADEANRKKIQDMARHQFITKMYAELLTDMGICQLENWDIYEFPRMLRDAINRCFPKPKQLTIPFA